MEPANYIFGPGKRPNYIRDKDEISAFLREFKDSNQEPKYLKYMDEVAKKLRIRFPVELDDIVAFQKQMSLVNKIEQNTLRYINLFSDVIDSLLPTTRPREDAIELDGIDLLIEQRNQTQQNENEQDTQFNIPKTLLRRFELHFISLKKNLPIPLRMVKSKYIGKMVTVRGIVTRCSDVKAELQVATYYCDKCGYEIYQEINNRVYMPLTQCPSAKCRELKVSGSLQTSLRSSKFQKFQEIRIQEMSDEIPTGNIPQMLKVHARGELTRLCSPGDEVVITGIYLPIPVTGMRALSTGPIAYTYLEAMDIKKNKVRYEDEANRMTPEEERLLEQSGSMYNKLAESIAPEIYGHLDVKKALLLQLIGGSHVPTGDNGVKIRGDINICLMGDPGIAKSQLLRYVARLSPRGVYTTGKGSSGVGLTAAVVKDETTGEMVLEGGALVLADNGICCIDEFDKMEEKDRTALHEVMEQQSISIAKAGITTTLNARTSVLAAANPLYGRYRPDRSPEENINMPAALLSRFDLLYIMVDKVDDYMDAELAEHITNLHRTGKPKNKDYFEASFLRKFIARAKRQNPKIPKELQKYIADKYVAIRTDEERSMTNNKRRNSSNTTPRTLLSILRFTTALCKCRLSNRVIKQDIDEACRLLEVSKKSIYDDRSKQASNKDQAIFDIIKHYCRFTTDKYIKIQDIITEVLARGYRQSDLEETLSNYEDIDIIQFNSDRTAFMFVSQPSCT